ncbi:MAG: glycosyltransferase [Loktanella sp.]|nr:glycosyltransferase [Loktanella sp.]
MNKKNGVMATLLETFRAHDGKRSDKWLANIAAYERLFAPYRDRPVRILEIGIQNGGSLEIWSKFFPNAVAIIGCDIDKKCRDLTYDDPRISVVVGDVNEPAVFEKVSSICSEFDIIIDDGSHVSGDIIRAFAKFFPVVSVGGMFIAEDLHCSYWADYQGGLEYPGSSLNFFRRLADLTNKEHWGGALTAADSLSYFSELYDCSFDEMPLLGVAEVSFMNSLAVVVRDTPEKRALGPRLVVGPDAQVRDLSLGLDGMVCPESPQNENAYGPASLRRETLNDIIAQRDATIATRDATIATREKELRDIANDLNALKREHSALNIQRQRLVDDDSALRRDLAHARSRALRIWLEYLTHKALLKLSASRLPLASRTRDRFARSAAKRDPDRSLKDPNPISGKPAKTRTVRQSNLRRLAFHKSGKPRGWFRAIALENPGGEVRSFFRRAFYKKNGDLRPDVAAYMTFSQNYGMSGLPRDPEEVARTLFANQQAELTPAAAETMIAKLPYQPLVSIIMPVYNTPIEWLSRAVESLQEQYYANWELCVVDDCSPNEDQRRLLREMAKDDPRIRLAVMPANGGISAASNLALKMARGEFVALVDHDDEITPDALLRVMEAINSNPDTDFLYTDECKICDTSDRRLFHFMLKPDWSPEIMFNSMLTGHLTVYRTVLVHQIGGFRSDYDFSQDYDLALRMAEVSRNVIHVERILYLWRAISGSAASGGKDFARETNIAALSDALVRREINGTAEIEGHANRVRLTLPTEGARVSIVIPSDSTKNLRLALDAIRDGTDYNDYEVCVVCNSEVAIELERDYADWVPAKFVRYDKPYNFSDKCNAGAEAAEGDIVVFYNDDVFPIGRDWIERLIEYLWIPGVGATSPQLLYQNGAIQYSGMISGTPGIAGTAFHQLPVDHCDTFLSLNRMVRNISVLSGACCAMRRELFLRVGGFDHVNTPDGHSDLDLSYKILEAGLRCVYTPYALLTHIGNHSWNSKPRKYKADIFCLKRWGRYLSRDRYFTPSMCKVLYHDFTFDYRIHAAGIDPTQIYTGPDVLFVSHEMTHTGAPHMLLEAAKTVKAAGGFPVVVTPADGPLRAAFEQEGIVVIIDASVATHHFLFERFARNFDVAVVNTSVLGIVAEQLAAIPTLRTLWWLHESQMLSKQLADVPAPIWDHVTAVCVSSYASSFLPEGVSSQILLNGLPDHAAQILPSPTIKPDGKLTFLLMGTIETRKGQDIFVEAILRLPEAVRADCNFVMVGKLWPGNVPFWERLAAKINVHPEISYLGDMTHDEALALIAACDILVSSSRDDAFSLVCVEAMQFGKPLIISDHVGVSEVLNEHASFVFPSGDVMALSDCITRAHLSREHLPIMGTAARKIYEEKLTDVKFARNFMELVGK